MNERKFTATVTLEVTKERILDLLCTGIEAGFFFLHHSPESKRPSDESVIPKEYIEQPYLAWCWGDGDVVFVNKDEWNQALEDETCSTDEVIRLYLNEEAIEKGLKLFGKHFPRHFADFIDDREDAITGDIFLQCCLLHEYVEKHGNVEFG